MVYPRKEAEKKVKEKHHFLCRVLEEKKIIGVGDAKKLESELANGATAKGAAKAR